MKKINPGLLLIGSFSLMASSLPSICEPNMVMCEQGVFKNLDGCKKVREHVLDDGKPLTSSSVSASSISNSIVGTASISSTTTT